jgi:hypothetical protein
MANDDLTKICTICQQEKPITDFYKLKSGKHGVTGMCKRCFCDYTKNKPNPYTPDPNAPTPMKICTTCTQEKPITDFHKSNSGKYGVKTSCKECSLQKIKERNFTFDPEKFGESITCSVCQESKHYSLFHNSNTSHNGKASVCKDCKLYIETKRNNTPEENYEKKLRLCTTCNEEKLGVEFTKSKAGRGGLCSKCKECYSKYVRDNPHIRNASAARRRAIKSQAIPKWFDKQKVDAIYEECSKITKETGIIHNVDHIVPLQSKWVCGLHVKHNLRIITGSENQRKLNTHWPDMPDRLDRSVAATERNLAKLTKS